MNTCKLYHAIEHFNTCHSSQDKVSLRFQKFSERSYPPPKTAKAYNDGYMDSFNKF